MKLIVDIPDEIYKQYMDDRVRVTDVLHAVRHGTLLKEWLSTFNTESATECFTAVQRLKESVDDRLDEGNTR